MKRHPLVAFLVLSALISWAFWIPWMLAARGVISIPGIREPLVQILGGLGPGLAAVFVTWRASGADGMQRLWRRFFQWRASRYVYLAALFLPAGLSLSVTALHTMFGGDAPDFSRLPIRDTVLGSPASRLAVWLTLGGLILLGEELGWRGFVLPRLQQRFDALISSLLLAAIWTLWAMPLSLAEPEVAIWWAVIGPFLQSIPGAIIWTWIFNNSQGSLLLTVLSNVSFKVTGLLVAVPNADPLPMLLPYWVAAIVIVAWAGAARFSRAPLPQSCRESTEPSLPETPMPTA